LIDIIPLRPLEPFKVYTLPILTPFIIICVTFLILHNLKINYQLTIGITSIVLLSTLIITMDMYGKNNANYFLYKGIATKNVSFQYDKSTIKSNRKLILVGETRTYLFLFDKRTNESFTYSKSEISNLIFKKLIDWRKSRILHMN
jgi:hypothetical protein